MKCTPQAIAQSLCLLPNDELKRIHVVVEHRRDGSIEPESAGSDTLMQ
jgi:hypothetical protein